MKLGFISDLHYDVNDLLISKEGYGVTEESMVQDTLEVMKEKELDYLFISGDIANGVKGLDIIRKLNTTNTKVYYVVGNHDLWEYGEKTEKLFSRFLKDEYCLVDKELKINEDVSVVGMFSWYDGTLGTEGKSEEYYETVKVLWADSQYIEWKKDNIREVKSRIRNTEKVLKGVKSKEIILLNHFVPSKRFIKHKPYDRDWNFGNGYMGTEKMEDLISSDKRIKYVTFGHSHIRYNRTESNGVTYINAPLGYFYEWSVWDFKKQLEYCLEVLTV